MGRIYLRRYWLELVGVGLLLGIWQGRLAGLPDCGYSLGEEVRIAGIVSRSEEIRGRWQQVDLGQARVKLDLRPAWERGDYLVVVGRVGILLTEGKNCRFFLEGGQIVDFEREKEAGFGFKIMARLRQSLLSRINRLWPGTNGALLAGILLGKKSGFGESFLRDLDNSGTIHMMVASGTNVVWVGMGLVTWLTIFLKRKWSLPGGCLGVVTYVILVGADPAVVRAGLLLCLVFLAQWWGRRLATVRLILLVGLLMLVFDPQVYKEIGFQLSFAATLGLVVGSGIWRRRRWGQGVPGGEDLMTTLAAMLATGPLLLYHFGRLGLLAPLANWLVLPWVSLVGIGGAFVLGLSYLWFGLARYLAILVWGGLSFMAFLIRFFGKWGANWQLEAVWPMGFVVGAYLFLMGLGLVLGGGEDEE